METKHSTSELVLFRPGTRAQVGESIIIKVDKKKQGEGLVLSHLPSNSLIGWVGIVLTEQIGYWGHWVLGTLGITQTVVRICICVSSGPLHFPFYSVSVDLKNTTGDVICLPRPRHLQLFPLFNTYGSIVLLMCD